MPGYVSLFVCSFVCLFVCLFVVCGCFFLHISDCVGFSFLCERQRIPKIPTLFCLVDILKAINGQTNIKHEME